MESPPESVKIQYYEDFQYEKKFTQSNIKFYDMDAIDCCLVHSPNALVLNLADDLFPGGCVAQGSGAQEEALFRRTNYCDTLKQKLYPIKNDEAIYSPQVSVIKTNEKTGWEILDKYPRIAFIACPGLKYPNVVNVNGEPRLQEEDVEILKIKVKTIIQTAVIFNHDTIIMGALGCGAWRNPVKHVAEIFKEVLQECDGVIKNYYFAILNTTDENYLVRNRDTSKKKTVDVFQEVFGLAALAP
jgi:uncharacterized protein (TIGR02452 family)